MDGCSFEKAMLAKYGCGSVETVAGRSRPASVLAVVLNEGILLTPRAFATLLVSWFGGFANDYRVRPGQPGSFLFQVAHKCIAKEIMLRDFWSSGIIRVSMSLSCLATSARHDASSAPLVSASGARHRTWLANSLRPSILGPRSCPPILALGGVHSIALPLHALVFGGSDGGLHAAGPVP